MYGRLTTALDCGTIAGERRVLLGFQLSEIIKKPKDETLPDYCAFAKYKYALLKGEDLDSVLKDMGVPNVAELTKLAGTPCTIEYHEEEYRGNTLYIVDSFKRADVVDDEIERGVEPKSFHFKTHYTDEQAIETLNEIRDLGFDNKHIKNSDEYNLLKQQIVESEEVPF